MSGNTVTIDAGQSYVDVTLAVVNDITLESTETASLTLAAGIGYAVGTTTPQYITITDDDPSQEVIDISVMFKNTNDVEVFSISAGSSFRIYVYAKDLRTIGADVGVLSAFADIMYDTSLINVTAIHPVFNDFTTGTINDPAGVVEEVGGLKNTVPSDRSAQAVFYLDAVATGVGQLTVSSNVGENSLSENQLFGVDGDLRGQTRYGSASIPIVGRPDLVGVALDVQPDHVLTGQTNLTFTVRNQGQGAAGAFDVRVVLSDDETIGNADDVVVTTVSIDSLAATTSVQRTLPLSLTVPTLITWARRDDLLGQGIGFRSTSSEYVGIIIDPSNTVTEENDGNNANQGKSVDKDDVTYFPWDTNSSGAVTPTDAGFVINRLGNSVPPADARADLDGNGVVSPTDAGGGNQSPRLLSQRFEH